VGRESAIAEVVRSCAPDLVVLQEAARPDVVAHVARAAEMPTWASHPNHSVAFMSRIPIAHHEWHRPAPSRRAFLEIVPEGDKVRIFGVHLTAVHSNWTEQRRVRELRALLKGIERHQHGFHLITGDFNTLAPGEQLDIQRLPFRLQAVLWLSGGRIRWETIQIMLDASYLDAYRMLHPKDPGFTFPTWDPHVRLDYAFVPAPSAPRLRACEIVTAAAGLKDASDHLPLLAEVDAD
jgi:endonuclease/exonuclease/phosphatase family metal-dependent hydrolase